MFLSDLIRIYDILDALAKKINYDSWTTSELDDDNKFRTRCRLCNCLIIDDAIYDHGIKHLKEKNLLPFL